MKKWSLFLVTASLVIGCMGNQKNEQAQKSDVAEASAESGLFFWHSAESKVPSSNVEVQSAQSVKMAETETKNQADIVSVPEADVAPDEVPTLGRRHHAEVSSKSRISILSRSKNNQSLETKRAGVHTATRSNNVQQLRVQKETVSEGVKVDNGKDNLKNTAVLERLEALAGMRSVNEQSSIIASKHFTEAGKKLYQSFKYEDARKQFRKAVRLDGSNDEARDYLARTDALLGAEGMDRVKTTQEWVVQEKRVRIQEIKMELERDLEKAIVLRRQGNLVQSKKNVDRVKERLKWLPADYGASMIDLRQRAEALSREIDTNLVKNTEQQELLQIEQAKELAQQKYLLEQKSHNLRVEQLLSRIDEFIAIGDFEKAQNLSMKVLGIDPGNQRAEKLLKISVDEGYRALAKKNEVLHDQKHRLSIEKVRESAIPWDKVLVYPDDWDVISQRSSEDIDETDKEAWAIQIDQKMQSPVTFNFEQTPIAAVIDFLRVATGVNIILDQNALIDEDSGEMREIPITLQVSDMPANTALDWVLKLANLKRTMRDQALFISTDVEGDAILKLYDIRDLTLALQDFPGPDVSLSTGDDDGGTVEFGEGEAESVSIGDIAELIQNNVSRDTWGENNTIEEHNGKLLVSQKPSVHKQIEELLAFFRRAKSMQVNIESRFITIGEDFLEEIGVNWGQDAQSPGYIDADSNETMIMWNANESFVQGSQLSKTGGFGFAYQFLNMPQLNFMLQALQKNGKGTVLSSPRITLANTQRGHIMVADQKSYIADYTVEENSWDPEVKNYQVGVVFDIRPIISADKKYITMVLRPGVAEEKQIRTILITTPEEVDSDGNVVSHSVSYPIELPELSIRKVRSTVTIPDGGTLSVGGKMTARRMKGSSGVPFLSNIPFLGRLFSTRTDVDENENLIILVHGRVILFEEEEAKL